MRTRGFPGRSFCTTGTWPGGYIPIERRGLRRYPDVSVVLSDASQKRPALPAHVGPVFLVLSEEIFEDIAVWQQQLCDFDCKWLGIHLGIVNGDLQVHM